MTILAAGVITVVGLLTATVAQPQSRTGGDRERLIGAWHLVRIDAPGQTRAAQPRGILIYTRDGHVSVQLMYPEAAHAADNEYVRGGYEASFGSYEVDEASHTVTHHVQGSITRDLLVGRDLRRVYQLTSDGHLVIRSANPDEHWSVTWEHY
ncbi:MAG TPA: lipocalin-like domain-containing protein [Acidobacteriaceae bacterium]|nr:lipocalin-like domain-containing protein [Acidobacteriaceae bacterium]